GAVERRSCPVRASGMTVPLQPLTQEEHHARFILELLLDDPAGRGPALEGPDWPLLARLAQRHAVLVRVADRLVDLGVPVPPGFAAAAEWERDRARATLDVLRLVQAACVRQRHVLGGTELCVPAPEDQLVLQGLEKVAGRRSFHLCDMLQTIAILRRPRLDWDRVLATAVAHGGWDGLSCYLHYVDEAHARLVGRELLAVEQRRTLTLHGWGHATLREAGFQFPAVRVTGWLHGRQFGRSLGRAEWNTALRLGLWPFAMMGTRLAQARTW